MRAFWGLCRTDFSVAASGIYDVRANAKGTHHKEKIAERGTMKSIQSLFPSVMTTFPVSKGNS